MVKYCGYPTHYTHYTEVKLDMDSEIQAMSDVTAALEPLDEEARRRVLRWANERFKIQPSKSTQTEPDRDPSKQFESFDQLFDAANPATASEKALVAAYYNQVVQGQEDFDSMALNRQLKHLGHSSRNITRDFDALIDRTPRLAMQVRKQGSTRQARKKYKLTAEGIKAVQKMLQNDQEDEQ